MEAMYGCISRFIGRHEEREQIKQVIVTMDVQLLQIYGLPSVGKTELVRQVCQELSIEVEIQTIYRRITNGLLLNSEICYFLQNLRRSKMLSVIVFDCFEKLSDVEEFNEFCLENIWNAPNLKIIVIFQGLYPLQLEGFSDERIQVKPMNEKDARCLFYRRAKLVLNEDSDTQVDELVNFCGALPGQIIELTNKISQFPPDTTLMDVYNYVRDNKTFCQSEDIFAKLDRYVQTLPPDQRHTYSQMVYFPGTFSVNDVTEMSTSYKDDLNSKFKFLYPLLGLGLLKSTGEDNGQYQIPALFQDYANQQLSHLRHEDTTKLRFSCIIGKTMTEAERLWEMGLSYEALGIMKDKWANVQKLLLQAIHSPSDGNSFQIYYKVAVDTSNIMSVCCPNESRLFCKAIFNNAQIFGSEDQQAISMACYGHTLADSSREEALQLYERAEGILRRFNHSYQFIVLLYNMSKVHYQSGRLQEGIRCAEEALTIKVADRDAADVQHVKTYAASYLAYNLIFATEYNKAEKILTRTLQEVGESGHPTVPTMLNSLGLKEERSKGDLNKALTFYFASLAKKRKIAKFQEPLLVTTLCNVAGQLSKTKYKHDFALTFLHEAEGIRRRAGWVHAYSALVVWNIGMVYMRKRMQVEALRKITEAEQLYEAVNREHYVNAEVKIWLAHCHLLLDNAEEAKRLFLEIVRNREMYQKNRPQGEFVLNALEHLIRLSIQDSSEQQTYIHEILKELPRLNKSSGVSPISSQIYRQLLLEYMELLLKIADNNEKSEPRSGVFLERIPETCLACLEVRNYVMCPKDTYLQKLSSLTTSCELFDGSNCNAVARVPCESEMFQLRQSEWSSPINICRASNVVNVLTSESSDESLNLPLPVKELCKSRAHVESVCNGDVRNFAKDVYLQKQNLLTPTRKPFAKNGIAKSLIEQEQLPKLEELMSTCKPFDQTPMATVVQCEQEILQQIQSERLLLPNIPNTLNKLKNNVSSLKLGSSDESIDSTNLPLPVKELCKSRAHVESVCNGDVCNFAKDVYLQKQNLLTPTRKPFAKNGIAKSLIEQEQLPKLEELMSTCKPFDQTPMATVVPCEQETWQQIQSERLLLPNIPNTLNKLKNNVSPLKLGSSDESIDSTNLPLPVKELCKSRAHVESVCNEDVHNYAEDFYLQKQNLLTPTCKPFDKNGIAKSLIEQEQLPKLEELMSTCKPFDQTPMATVVPCEQETLQQIQSERLLLPNILGALNQSKNNDGSSKLGSSDDSVDSMNLPLPVKELYKPDANLRSVDHDRKQVSPKLPDFSALLSLGGSDVDDENNRIEPGAVTARQQQPNVLSERISKNDQMNVFPKTNFTDSTEKFAKKLLERNGTIAGNKQSWDFNSSTIKKSQNEKYQEFYCKANSDNTRNMNTGTNMFHYSGTRNNTGINELRTIQRDISDPAGKQNHILSSQQMANVKQQNGFTENNSKFPFQNIAPASNSFDNFYLHNPPNGQRLRSNSQSKTAEPVQMMQHSKDFLENGRNSQHLILTNSRKNHLDHFTNNNPVSKISHVHPNLLVNSSSSQRSHLNAVSCRRQIYPNRCSANTNINNNSPLNENIVSDSLFPTNNLSQNLQVSCHTSRFRSREPVEHEEKND